MESDNGNGQKPSGLIPFQPGQSGNPGGRTKFALVSKAARARLAEIDPKTGLSGAQTIVEALYREACRGNVKAFRELREICEGKITPLVFNQIQQNVITGNDGMSIKERLLQKFLMYGESTAEVALPTKKVTIRPTDGSTNS